METQLDVKTLKGVLRRRKKAFGIPFVLILLVAACIAYILPPIYRSETTILIEGQQIPEEYVRTTIRDVVEERLEMIKQQVLRRSKLIEIIDEFNLYADIREKQTIEAIISKMRDAIEIRTVSARVSDQRTGRMGSVTVAFKLSYEGKDPTVVQRVTTTLASLYLEEDLKRRSMIAGTTTEFLERESENIKEQILGLENKISEFKEAHIGELPEHSQVNLQAYTRMERDIERLNARIGSLEERKIYLQGQIAQVEPLNPVLVEGSKVMRNPKERLKALRLELIGLQSALSDRHPDVRKLKSEIAKLEAQVGDTDDSVAKVRLLAELTGRLAEMKGRLGPKHPDVIQLSREVELLSKEVDRLMTDKATTEISEEKPDNPVYVNLMTQITSAEMELKYLREEKDKTQEEMKKYQSRIERAPLVEKEYIELTRDYEGAKRKYQEIMSKLLTAKVAQGMEETQRGEKFTITEPAHLPEKPYKPNRMVIVLIGFVLAVGAGVGFAAFQEAMDYSLKSEHEIGDLTQMPVFSTIPLMESDHEKHVRVFKRMILVATGICTLVAAALLIHHFVMPLEIVWVKIQNRAVQSGMKFL
jgi:uncharacterized protein involved in exopolysaccharide biosynthesis